MKDRYITTYKRSRSPTANPAQRSEPTSLAKPDDYYRPPPSTTTTTYKINPPRSASRSRSQTADTYARPIIVTTAPAISSKPPPPKNVYPTASHHDYHLTPNSSLSRSHDYRSHRKRHSTALDNADMTRLATDRSRSRTGPVYTSSRVRGPVHADALVRRADTVADDYGDNGYGYTNPRDLVEYDLKQDARPARPAKRDSFESRARPVSTIYPDTSRSYYAREAPSSSRQWEKMPAATWEAPARTASNPVDMPPPHSRSGRSEAPDARHVSVYHDRPRPREPYYDEYDRVRHDPLESRGHGAERIERGERDRGERSDRYRQDWDRRDRTERLDRPERSERAERSERLERSERADYPDRLDRAERGYERGDRDRPIRSERHEHPERIERAKVDDKDDKDGKSKLAAGLTTAATALGFGGLASKLVNKDDDKDKDGKDKDKDSDKRDRDDRKSREDEKRDREDRKLRDDDKLWDRDDDKRNRDDRKLRDDEDHRRRNWDDLDDRPHDERYYRSDDRNYKDAYASSPRATRIDAPPSIVNPPYPTHQDSDYAVVDSPRDHRDPTLRDASDAGSGASDPSRRARDHRDMNPRDTSEVASTILEPGRRPRDRSSSLTSRPSEMEPFDGKSEVSNEPISRRPRISGPAFNPKDTMDLQVLKDQLNAQKASPPRAEPILARSPRASFNKDPRELEAIHAELADRGREAPRPIDIAPEARQVRVVSPPREKMDDKKTVKGILRQPRERFPEDPAPIREGVAPLKDARKDGVPPDARWTKIARKLVNPEALEAGKERYEAREDFVIVLRVLSREEIQAYATATQQIRGSSSPSHPV